MPLRGTNSRGALIADRPPQIEPVSNLAPLVCRRLTRRVALMTMSWCIVPGL